MSGEIPAGMRRPWTGWKSALLWFCLLWQLAGVSGQSPLAYDLILWVNTAGGIQGTATITGPTEVDWPEVLLRFYPAALGEERLFPQAISVDEEALSWDSVDPSVIVVPLDTQVGQASSLSVGGSLTVEFQGEVPPFEEAGGYGIFARSEDAIVLAQGYPLLAPWEGGWNVEPVLPWGDALVAEVADYTAEIFAPVGWTPVTSGEEEALGPGRFRVVGEDLRELGIVLVQGYECEAAFLGDIELRSFFSPKHRAAGEAALGIALQALGLYQELFGPYPFPELDLVEVPLRGAAGVEYPGLILAGQDYYARFPEDPLFFPMIFAHEVAHQWWYAQVGNDQVAEPWLDEALVTYTSGLYFEAQGRFQEILAYWEDSYALGRERNPEALVTSPLWEFPEGRGYGGIVYSGGALFLHEVRTTMGDDAFFRALRRYLHEFKWQIAHGKDLLHILREESPVPIDHLIARWLGHGEHVMSQK